MFITPSLELLSISAIVRSVSILAAPSRASKTSYDYSEIVYEQQVSLHERIRLSASPYPRLSVYVCFRLSVLSFPFQLPLPSPQSP